MIVDAFKIASRRRLGPSACVVLLETLETPQTAGALAKAAGVSSAAITGTMDRLTEAGLVKVERCEIDRRRVLVTLTQKGEHLAKQFNREGGDQ